MPEETLFEIEEKFERSKIAEYLRSVADSLEAGGPITLTSGEASISVDPPGTVTFEVEVEREGPSGGPGELSLEFELEWDEADSGKSGGGGELKIE